MAEIDYETDVLKNNDAQLDALRKEVDELKYQIEREKREGDRLKQVLGGASGDQAEEIEKMRRDLDKAIAEIDSMKEVVKDLPPYIAGKYINATQ